VHNLSAQPLTTRVQLHEDDLAARAEGEQVWLDDLFAHQVHDVDAEGGTRLTMEGYGHAWLRVRRDSRPPV
jgi:hypothetical protein